MKYDRSYDSRHSSVIRDAATALPKEAIARYMLVAEAASKVRTLPSEDDLDEEDKMRLEMVRKFRKRIDA